MSENKAPDPPLRVLILEDDPADAELVERELRRTGIAFSAQRTEGKRGFAKALRESAPQVILSDFNLPGFDGLAALQTAREISPEVPFIFVSGSIGEEKAIETLALGAADYIFKDNLARLGPAVKRVLAAAELQHQKQAAEESLHESERMYSTLVANLPGFVYRCRNDREWTMEYISEGCREITGYGPEDFIHNRNLSFNDIIHPDHRQALWKEWQADLEQRRAFEEEYRIITASGEVRWVWEHGQGVYAGDGTLLFLEGFIANVTPRHQAEDQLRQSEEYYRTLVDTSPDAIVIVDAGGRVTFASRRTFEIFAIPPQTVITGISVLDFVEAGERGKVKERMAEIRSGRAHPGITVYRLLRHNRQPFWGEVTSSPLRDAAGRGIALLLVCRDVSERRQTEEQVRYQASVLQDVSDAIIATEENGAIRMWNRAAETIYGWKAEEALNMPIHQLLSPAYRFQERGEIFEKLGRDGAWSGEIIHHHRDGRPLTIQSSITSLKGPGGEPAGMVSINSDITERKRVEAEFLRERVFLEKLVETAPEGIVIADNQGRVLKVNSEFVRMFGYDSDEAPGKLIDDLVVPPQYREEAQTLNQSVSEGKKAVLESVRSRKDGSLLHVSIIIAPIYIEGEQVAVYAIYQDISERKRAEAIQHIQYDIANAVVTSKTFLDLFETVRNKLSTLLDTTNFLIALYDEASGMLSAPFEKDEKDAIPRWPVEKSLTGLVVKQKRSMLLRLEDIQQLEQAGTTEAIGSIAKAWLGVPLRIADKILGAIVVQSYVNAEAYDQSSVSIMEMIANQVSVYIERKQAEAAILQEKAFLESLVETAPEGIAIHDKLGRVLRVNSEFERMFGYDAGEVVGKVIDDLIVPPQSREEAGALTQSVGAGGKVVLETVRKRKDGTLFNVSIIGAPIHIGERQVAVYAIYRDITERRRAEELIRASLREKEVLLKEIHHRVKNNLQIISGLLTLQADQAAAKTVREIFQESQDRIRSIALIHEKLYGSHNLSEIAFDDYLRALVDNLLISHSIAAGLIRAAYDMERIFFTIEKAIPLGLIVNELVTNSIKHAFPSGRGGEIRIGLRQGDFSRWREFKSDSGNLHRVPAIELTIADDGVGLPKGFALQEQRSLGMHLVGMLVKQLQAEVQVGAGAGSEFRIVIPAEHVKTQE